MTIDDLFGAVQSKKEVNNVTLVDFSNLLHSSYHTSQVRFDKSLKSNTERYQMWRYILLTQILNIKSKLQPDEIVLAIDSSSWRKKEYKYYKANRKLLREKNKDFNYEEFVETANQFVAELKENFPYKVIQIPNAEADDVIGALVKHLAEMNINHTIVSRDKDFKQLLKYASTKIYDPIDKKFKEEQDPFGFLLDHILVGDSADGIPNMLSDDNVFVDSSKRQKKITKRVREEVNELGIEEYAIRNNLIDNYERNSKLIDLEYIPEEIYEQSIFEYNNQHPVANFMKVTAFFKKHNIRSLQDKVGQFL